MGNLYSTGKLYDSTAIIRMHRRDKQEIEMVKNVVAGTYVFLEDCTASQSQVGDSYNNSLILLNKTNHAAVSRNGISASRPSLSHFCDFQPSYQHSFTVMLQGSQLSG